MATYIRVGRSGSSPAFLNGCAGVATASITKLAPFTISQYSNCGSRREDSTYPTVQNGTITTQPIAAPSPFRTSFGKISNGSTGMVRARAGITFTIPSVAALSGVTQASLSFNFFSYSSTFVETWAVACYLSSTDDSGLYGTTTTKAVWDWEANLNTYIGAFTYGATSTQSISLPYATIFARAGSRVSFILGCDLELAGTGITTPAAGKVDSWEFQNGFAQQITFQ